MSFEAIRLSPSGPIIKNDDGGTLVPGEGFQLRLNEASTTIDPTFTLTPSTDTEVKNDPSDANAPFLRPQLDNPLPSRRYRVTGKYDVNNEGAGTAQITTTIEASFDGGSNWTQLARNNQTVNAAQVKHCELDAKLALGSAAGMTGNPADIRVRMLVSASIAGVRFESDSATNGTDGTAYLGLTEHL